MPDPLYSALSGRLREVLDDQPATEGKLRSLAEEADAGIRALEAQIRGSERRLRELTADAESSLTEIASELRRVELLRPELIVPVGGLAIRRLLGISGLAECIGRRYELDAAAVVPLPHPSGASSWLNSLANRELTARAAALVREELARL